jgi:hypothetical protein
MLKYHIKNKNLISYIINKMLKTIGLLSILPMLSFAFFIPFSFTNTHETKENANVVVYDEKNASLYTGAKICPFINYVDKELCDANISVVDTNRKEVGYYREDFKMNLDPKDLCPLLELVDKTFCNSTHDNYKNVAEKVDINPKDLCPLLELVQTKLCS